MVNVFPFFSPVSLCSPDGFIKGDAVLTPFGEMQAKKGKLREITQWCVKLRTNKEYSKVISFGCCRKAMKYLHS